jgi:molecular chaperone GrpE
MAQRHDDHDFADQRANPAPGEPAGTGEPEARQARTEATDAESSPTTSAGEDEPRATAEATGKTATGEAGVEAQPEAEGSESGGPDDPVLAQLVADLETVTRERDEFLEAAQRLQAEFKNYRERVARQQQEAGQKAVAAFVTKLLPALDALELALAHAASEGGEQAGALAQVHAVFQDILTKEGLEPIEPIGKRFDPTEAEAVAHEAGEGEPTVSEVLRLGYRWRGQVIRPAMVKVTGS